MMHRESSRKSGVMARLIDVVLVHDEGDARERLSARLAERRCAVRAARQAADALALVRESTPDVVVADLDLAIGASAWALASALREDPRARHVPRLALIGSGLAPLELLRVFDAYVQKPVDPTELHDALVELTATRRRATL